MNEAIAIAAIVAVATNYEKCLKADHVVKLDGNGNINMYNSISLSPSSNSIIFEMHNTHRMKTVVVI